MKLPELSYGSIWLIAAGTGGEHDLSPLAVHALRTAEAVLHDPETSKAILDLIIPLRYREAAPPQRAIERAIKLAQDGWRVVKTRSSSKDQKLTPALLLTIGQDHSRRHRSPRWVEGDAQ